MLLRTLGRYGSARTRNDLVAISALVALMLGACSRSDSPPARPLDNPVRGALMVRLSNDGKSLAFSYQGAIWRMPRDGGLMTRLTNDAGFDIQPAWSPDGRQIAFINTDSFMGGKLQIIDAATGKLVRESQDLQVYGNLYFDPTNRDRKSTRLNSSH